MSGDPRRGGLFIGSALAIVLGVGLLFGLGAALVVAGLFGFALAVAWTYVAVTPDA